MHLECFHREAIVRRHKYNRREVPPAKVAQNLESISLRELDIEKNKIRLMSLDRFDGGASIPAFRHHLDLGVLLQQYFQALSRQRFVFYDDRANLHFFAGIPIVTTTPPEAA